MLRRILALLAVLVMVPGLCMAEESVLVDAITNPKAEEGFAFAEGAELLEVVFPQILDCDSALLRCGGETMLLDCANKQQADRVVSMLEQMGVTELDYVVNTHPHYDHIEGIAQIAEAVKIKAFYICFPEDMTDHMVKALEVCAKYDIPVVHYGDGDQFKLGDTVIDVWMKCDEECNLNERSAQMRMQFGQRTALFAADMQKKTQQALLTSVDNALLDIDLLKYKKIPHATTVPGFVYCVTDGDTWLVKRLDMDNPITVTSRPDTRK